MAMRKRCKEEGCTKAPRCDHDWWYDKKVKGMPRKRMRAMEFAGQCAPSLIAAGKPVPRPPKTAAEAKEWYPHFEVWVNGGCQPFAAAQVATEGTLIRDAADVYVREFIQRELKANGQEGIMKRLQKAMGHLPLPSILSRTLLQDLLDETVERTSNRNGNAHRVRISHFINWLRAHDAYKLKGDSPWYHRTINPHGVKAYPENGGRHRRIEAWEDAALRKAMAALDDGGMMLARYEAAIDVCFRRGEMLKIKREDVLWKEVSKHGCLMLRLKATNTKSGRERLVPCSARVAKFLEGRRFVAHPFGQLDGTFIKEFNNDWQTVLLTSGLEAGQWVQEPYRHWMWTKEADLHWHDLRHEGASLKYENGMLLAEIQELLGHAKLEMTSIYLNVKTSNLVSSFKRAVGDA